MNPETIARQIYSKYPEMQPYVGEKYRPSAPWSILLVGESYYQEDNQPITQHKTPESWYSGDHTGNIQHDWINGGKIIADNISNGFPNKAHCIYRNSFKKINEAGPQFNDWREISQYIAFVNYFHRPAENQGKSIRVHPIDQQVAELVLCANLRKLSPKLVVFLSKTAFRHCSPDKLKEYPCTVVCTPHPGTSWWNRKSSHWEGKGHEVLTNAVSLLDWSEITQ